MELKINSGVLLINNILEGLYFELHFGSFIKSTGSKEGSFRRDESFKDGSHPRDPWFGIEFWTGPTLVILFDLWTLRFKVVTRVWNLWTFQSDRRTYWPSNELEVSWSPNRSQKNKNDLLKGSWRTSSELSEDFFKNFEEFLKNWKSLKLLEQVNL